MKSASIFLLSKDQLDHWVRVAETMAESTLGIPTEYRGNVGNCLNAIEMALRLNVSPLTVMQNLRNIGDRGNPVWTSNFVRAMIDNSGLFSESLHFEVESQSKETDYRVRAVTTALDGKLKVGDWINWTMVHLMGWGTNLNWQAIPEVMFRARATSAFGNEHCNSLLMGFLDDEARTTPAESVVKAPALTPQPATDFAILMDLVQTAQVPVMPLEEGNVTGEAPSAAPMDKPTIGTDLKPVEQTAPLMGAPAVDTIADISAVMVLTETGKVPATPSPEGTTGTAPTEPGKNEAKAEPKVRKPRAPKVEAKAPPPPPSLQMEMKAEDDTLPPAPEPGPTTQPLDANLAREFERAEVFSKAMLEIEKAAPTKAGLEAAIAVADGFGEPEKLDLYGIILDQTGAQIEKLAVNVRGNEKEGKAFLATARMLFINTKDMVTNHPEIAPNRARLVKAYNAMIDVVAKLTAAAKAI